MKVTKILVFSIFFIFLYLPKTNAQTSITQAEAIFIYNFTRLIEWPPDYKKGGFVIGIYGSTDVFNEIQHFVKGKTVGSQPISVVKYNNVENIGRCHILFVAFGKTKELPAIINQIGNNKTLVVGEKTGILNEGAAINFMVIDDKLKFELKAGNASKYGLKVLSSLEKLAVSKY